MDLKKFFTFGGMTAEPTKPTKANASKEVGSAGYQITGGIINYNEKNPLIANHSQRHLASADILANISIIAASVRYYLNLLSNPNWSVRPVDDSSQAAEAAEFVESVMHDMNSSWTRVIRRNGMYKWHGFNIAEWTAKKREDGKIGFVNVEQRPQHTIERWAIDDNGVVLGVWQMNPNTQQEVFIDRWKLIYLVDDTLTDSPDGMGWFRHCVEPAQRLKEYLTLEKIGFERDLAGIPVGKAPITAINRAIKSGAISKQQGEAMLDGIKNFVKMEVKKQNTGLILDSQTFENTTSDGTQATSVNQWGMDLLTSNPGNMASLQEAINRIQVEIARIIGTENIFTGTDGSGSLALSQDKSTNLYLNVNSALVEMAEQFDKDFIGPLWRLNGFDEKLKPSFQPEEVAFKDAEAVSVVLRNMAQAGAVLAPDDPAINDLRMLLGVSEQEGFINE